MLLLSLSLFENVVCKKLSNLFLSPPVKCSKLGADSIQRWHLTSIGNPIVEIRRSYLHNGISYTGKMTSLFWIRALVSLVVFTRDSSNKTLSGNTESCLETCESRSKYIKIWLWHQTFSHMLRGLVILASSMIVLLLYCSWCTLYLLLRWWAQ